MAVAILDLAAQHDPLRQDLRDAFDSLLANSQFILGPAVQNFESDLAGFCQTRHAIALSSGTDALLMALMAHDIGIGDEVIVPSFTFFATAGTVHRVGATPIFVDIDQHTFNLDVPAVERAITDRTKAIIPVHLFGQCAEMDHLRHLAQQRRVLLIEDAAQAIGATDDNRPAGSMGSIGCLSFYPTKNLGALGDAGACLTDDDDLAQRLRHLRVHGQTDEYHHQYVGGNFRIDALQAAFLQIKLRHLPAWTAARQAAAARYDQLLAGLPIALPAVAERRTHVYNQYTIRCRGRHTRENLLTHLRSRSIGCRVYYPLPLHLQPCFAHLGYRRGDLPESEKASDEVLSLPIYPEITAEQQQEVADALHAFFEV